MQPHEPPPSPDLGPGAEAPSARTLRRLEARKVASERYRLDGEIARGGMGAILRVWDEDLCRHLAMKVILREPSDPEGTYRQRLARFLEEAQVTGQLDHPAIVPVHELGLDQKGQVYFTMHLVKGSTFGEVIRSVRQGDSTWTTTRALFPLLRAAEALAFAHERRVLHRDVKPANLMVGRHGETYVMDWGLARLLDDPKPADPSPAATVIRSDRGASEETGDGSVVGTPAYMAPEQARGEDQRLGPGVDIYALGAVLYELLAGHAPFADLLGSRAAPSEVWRALLAGPPTPLSRCAPRAPAELVAIAERAMAREPAARYPSMEAMAEDLRAYLEGRVVRAHAVGPLVELWKWTKRNRFAASSAAALAAVVLTSGFWILALERRGEADRAEQAARREAAALLVEGEGLASVHPEEAQPLAEWLARAEALLRLHPAPQGAPTLDRAALLAAPAGQVAAALLSEADWLAARVQHVEDFRASRLDPSDPKRTAREAAILGAEIERLKHAHGRAMGVLSEAASRLLHGSGSHSHFAAQLWLLDAPDWGMVQAVRGRAQTVARLAESRYTHADAWAAVAGPHGSNTPYPGLVLKPQVGLVPLGPNPSSGLLEFWVETTGTCPIRAEDGTYAIGPRDGLVLVLIPAPERPVVIQFADAKEPVVLRSPYFVARHELTIGQWQRLGAPMPNLYGPGWQVDPAPMSDASHPVESVGWSEARSTLARAGLRMPSEAEWLWAAGGGVDSEFWFGSADRAEGRENWIGLETLGHNFPGERLPYDDGWVIHAPVDSLAPNPFGLHHVHGNVAEWVLDTHYAKQATVRAREGPAQVAVGYPREERVVRGGGYSSQPSNAGRSARYGLRESAGAPDVGLRAARSLDP